MSANEGPAGRNFMSCLFRNAKESGGPVDLLNGLRKVLVREAFAFRNVDLNELAFVHGQLDCAKAEFCECIKHSANRLRNGGRLWFSGPIFRIVCHIHPLQDGLL